MPILASVAGFLWKRPWVLALGALLVVSGGLYVKLRTVAGQLVQVKQQVQLLSAEIELQNHAVEAWKIAAGAQADRVKEAEKEAARQRKTAASRVQRLLNEPVPAACPDAIRWAASIGPEIASGWEASP